MAPISILALFALGFSNFAMASTAISSEVVPAVPTNAVTSVVVLTSTVYTPVAPVPAVSSTPVSPVYSGPPMVTVQTSMPPSPSAVVSSMPSVSVGNSTVPHPVETTCLTHTNQTSVTSIVTGPVSSVDSGYMTIQTSTNVGNHSTPVMGTSILPTPSIGTIIITHTANRSTVAPTGTQPSASASTTAGYINAAAGLSIGALGFAGAVAVGVFGA